MLCFIFAQDFGKNPDTHKRCKNLNTFKQDLKKYLLKEPKNSKLFSNLFSIFNYKHRLFLYYYFEQHDSLLLRDSNVNTSKLL